MNTFKQKKSSINLNYFLLFVFILILLFKNSFSQNYHNYAAKLYGNSGSYIAARSNTLNIAGAFTIEAWINPESNSAGCVICKGAALMYYGAQFNAGRIELLTNNGVQLRSKVSTVIPLNKWTHFAATYDGVSSFKIYINGLLDSSSVSPGHTPIANSDSLYIGKRGTNALTNAYAGNVDEIRIWNREVTAPEIKNNFRSTLAYCSSGVYDGLQASYPFQQDCCLGFDDADYSNHGNQLYTHGITSVDLTNNPSQYLSFNEALQLDGNGDYLSLVNTVWNSPTTAITIEAWIYPLLNFDNAIVGKDFGTSYYLGISNTGTVRFMPVGTTGNFLDGKTKLPLKQWTHVAVTYTSGSTKIYVNGALDTSATNITGPIPTNNSDLYIGADRLGATPSYFFQGYLDCVKICDFVKTQQQIRNFMYQSVDQQNRLDPAANEYSFNFDGWGSSATYIAQDIGIFVGNAKFSNPATTPGTPVSPVDRVSGADFSNNWTMKTANRRIPQAGTSGNMIDDSLFVTTASSIGGIRLFLGLNHTNISDLVISLISPSGDSIKVFNKQTTVNSNNNLVTVFDDYALKTLTSNQYVEFSPLIQPFFGLGDFYGGSLLGYWKLRIQDTKAGDTGRVYAWGIYNDLTLPVELSSFTAAVNNNDVILKWVTTEELNNSGFDIERSPAATHQWTKVGFILGNGTTNSPKEYSFRDNNLSSGKYNYRLKQIDYNGNFEYHNLSSDVNVGAPGKYELSQNYPNPFNPATKINFNLPQDSKVTLQVFDITGRLISTLINNESLNAGFYSKQFDGSNFSSGNYFYKVTADNFTMTRKMTLVK